MDVATAAVAANKHISPAAMTPAKLWGWGLSRVGGNHFRSKAVRVGFAGSGEDRNGCEHSSQQYRYHYAFHFGFSPS
jgi:hypothetical protein